MTAPISTFATPEVNTVAAQRIVMHDDAARAAGFNPSTPWFAAGTRLVDVGQHNFRQSRQRYEDKPTVEEALPELIAVIEAEARLDVDVTPDRLTMRPDGTLFVQSSALPEDLFFSEQAFKQLCTRMSAHRAVGNFGAYFASTDPEHRARMFNEEVGKYRGNLNLRLRTRTPNGNTEVFAVTSQSYTPVDAHVLAHTILHNTDPETRVDVLYSGTRSKIDLLYHNDLPAPEVGVGEYYKAAQTFRSNDDGTSSITGGVSLYQAICINLTTVELAMNVLRRRHVGDLHTILEVVKGGIGVGQHKLQFFLEAWKHQSTVDVRPLVEAVTGKRFTFDTPRPIFRALFGKENKAWAIPGVSAEQVSQAAEEAWGRQALDWSVMGMSNALSRAAHESAWPSLDMEQVLQDRSGALITTKRIPWGAMELIEA